MNVIPHRERNTVHAFPKCIKPLKCEKCQRIAQSVKWLNGLWLFKKWEDENYENELTESMIELINT